MANEISTFVKRLDRVASSLEASELLLSAQIDAHEEGDEDIREHMEGSCNLMLDRTISQLANLLEDLRDYKYNER